ncbi:hypothetical protein HMI54_007079 [Coelomomyces lativittatus]|nr:hypothetical protein HMI56_000101 [Coelomomyces lativittatus]KAJ1516600.1 hypothetical protein HMI55_001879 [Coelomomyces lativittatus]KAJ1517087.1 hypothetical protein HMI54_007079 [Coelomomyces lativittatus]
MTVLKTTVNPLSSGHSLLDGDVPFNPVEKQAQFATTSRLLSCLVNEHLVNCKILTFENLCVEFSTNHSVSNNAFQINHGQAPSLLTGIKFWAKLTNPLSVSNECILVPLQKLPVIQPNSFIVESTLLYLDPDDIFSDVVWFYSSNTDSLNSTLTQKNLSLPSKISKSMLPFDFNFFTNTVSATTIWSIIGKWHNLTQSSQFQAVHDELESSMRVQEIYFKKKIQEPYVGSPSIVWERAIVEGHPVHPMHRARIMRPPLNFDYDQHFLENPLIVFASVPKTQFHFHGVWQSQIHPYLLNFVLTRVPTFLLPESHTIVPAHVLQWKYLQSTFPNRFELIPDVSVPAMAQASTRTLVPMDSDFCFGYHFKLPLCVIISSALRTVSQYSIHNGPLLSELASSIVDSSLCFILKEVASIGLIDENEHVAKLFGCILRVPEPPLMYVCAGLLEKSTHAPFTPRVVNLFQLHDHSSKLSFFKHYVSLFLRTMLPPLLQGYAFEAHVQNVLVQIQPKQHPHSSVLTELESQKVENTVYEITGFGVRDFGGVLIHPPSLLSSSKDDIVNQLYPNSPCIAQDMDSLYKLAYHTVIFCHLHRLLRVLDLHDDRSGWKCLYEELIAFCNTHPNTSDGLLKAWVSESSMNLKSFLKMKLESLYRDFLYEKVPNLILLGTSLTTDMKNSILFED